MAYKLIKSHSRSGDKTISLYHIGDSKSILMGHFTGSPYYDFDPVYPAVGFDLSDCREIVSIAERIDNEGLESVWNDAADPVDDESEYDDEFKHTRSKFENQPDQDS